MADLVKNVLSHEGNTSIAVLLSAFFAVASVVINLWGGLLTERKRADLVLELERNKAVAKQQQEIQSVIARYRGQLLEAAIDLEQRLWHLATDEDCDIKYGCEEEEATYITFCLAQFLGFLEVVRREGPRERPFLQAGNPQGSDTLFTLAEGIRFVLCGAQHYLEEWERSGDAMRSHPGARPRKSDPAQKVGRSLNVSKQDLLRISRGAQRAIGSLMLTTPNGAQVHYCMSYLDFCRGVESEPSIQQWIHPVKEDIAVLMSGQRWAGEMPFPFGRWTRVLMLQQLLVDTIDLLDPDCVRFPMERRVRLRPIVYGPLPRAEEYQANLREMSQALSALPSPSSPWSAADKQRDNSTEVYLSGLSNLLEYSNKGMLKRMNSLEDGMYLDLLGKSGRNQGATEYQERAREEPLVKAQENGAVVDYKGDARK